MIVELLPPAVAILAKVTAVRRREIRDIIECLPAPDAHSLLGAFQSFAEAAGEVPDSRWAVLLDAPPEPFQGGPP